MCVFEIKRRGAKTQSFYLFTIWQFTIYYLAIESYFVNRKIVNLCAFASLRLIKN